MKKLLTLTLVLLLLLGVTAMAEAADISGCDISLPSSTRAGGDITIVITGNNAPNVARARLTVYKGYESGGVVAYSADFTGLAHTIPACTLPGSQSYEFVLNLWSANDATTLKVSDTDYLIPTPTDDKPVISVSTSADVGQALPITWAAVDHMDKYQVEVKYSTYADYSGKTYISEYLTDTSFTIPGTAFPVDSRYTITVSGINEGKYFANTSFSMDVNTENPLLTMTLPDSLPVGSAFNIVWNHAEHADKTMYLRIENPDGSLAVYGDQPGSPSCYAVEEGLLRYAGTYMVELYCKTCGATYKVRDSFVMTGEDMGKPTTVELTMSPTLKQGEDLVITWKNVPKTTKYALYLNGSLIALPTTTSYTIEADSQTYGKLRAGNNTISVSVREGYYKVSSEDFNLYMEACPPIAVSGIPESHPQYEPLTFSWETFPGTKYYRLYVLDGTWTLEQMINLHMGVQLSATQTSYTIPMDDLVSPGEYSVVVRALNNDLEILSQTIVNFDVAGSPIGIVEYDRFNGPGQTGSITIKPYPKATSYRIYAVHENDGSTFDATGEKQTLTFKGFGTFTLQALCPDGVLQSTTFKVAGPGSKVPDIVVLSVGEKYDMWPHASKMKIYNIINSDIDWRMNTSSSAVELTRKGYIIARRPGKAVIHLDNWFSDKLDVVVYVGTKLKSITINGPDTLVSGKSVTLKAAFNPSNATYKNVKWKVISGGNAATVTASGKLTAKSVTKPTKVVVAVYTTDVSCINAYHEITVTPGATAVNVFDENGESLNGKTIIIDMNNGIPTGTESVLTRQASFEVLPASALQKVTWKTSNKKVAKVNSAGRITAVGDGTATITATATDGSGKKVTFKVRVLHKPYEIAVTGNTSLTVGQTITLKGTVGPANATNKNVKWSTDNPEIATISAKGVLTAVSEGTVTVTAQAAGNSAVTATHVVTVLPKATSVNIFDPDGNSVKGKTVVLDLNVKETVTLSAALLPDNAAQGVTWKTSNKKIAKVNSAGKVTPVAEGKATITATAKDGSGRRATVTIKVTRLATGVTLTGTKQISVGQTVALKAKAANASLQKFTWVSDNPDVATVTSAGKITGVGVGMATITATTRDGTNLSASMTVSVIPAATSITVHDPDGRKVNGRTIKLDLSKKQKVKLTFDVLPEDALQKVTWKSSNTKVAKVSKAGLITPVATGKAVITLTAADGSGVIAKVTIRVIP